MFSCKRRYYYACTCDAKKPWCSHDNTFLQPPVANPHLSKHIATQHGNIHAAIPLGSATQDSKSPYNCAHTQMQPKKLETTVPLPQKRSIKTHGPHLPHTRGTFHRWPERLYMEKHEVSRPNYLPKPSPCNIHTAITMRFETALRKSASLEAHGNTTWQH